MVTFSECFDILLQSKEMHIYEVRKDKSSVLIDHQLMKSGANMTIDQTTFLSAF